MQTILTFSISFLSIIWLTVSGLYKFIYRWIGQFVCKMFFPPFDQALEQFIIWGRTEFGLFICPLHTGLLPHKHWSLIEISRASFESIFPFHNNVFLWSGFVADWVCFLVVMTETDIFQSLQIVNSYRITFWCFWILRCFSYFRHPKPLSYQLKAISGWMSF